MPVSSKNQLPVQMLFDALKSVRRMQEAVREFESRHFGKTRLLTDVRIEVDGSHSRLLERLLDRVDGYRGLDFIQRDNAPSNDASVESEVENLLYETSSNAWWLPAPDASDCWAVRFAGEWWTLPNWLDRVRQPTDADDEAR